MCVWPLVILPTTSLWWWAWLFNNVLAPFPDHLVYKWEEPMHSYCKTIHVPLITRECFGPFIKWYISYSKDCTYHIWNSWPLERLDFMKRYFAASPNSKEIGLGLQWMLHIPQWESPSPALRVAQCRSRPLVWERATQSHPLHSPTLIFESRLFCYGWPQ